LLNNEKSDPSIGAVLVLGGGISGISASLDLASMGFKVYLVEKSPMVGGRMAQLDKTFPTCDCSMCILSPKLIECHRHPNIDILANTEIKGVEGEAGRFSITMTRKPRYVQEALCVGCGLCTSYCPKSTPDQFNEGLSDNKAISLFCPQSVPLVSSIDPDSCLFLNETKCKICSPVCKHHAIDFTQTEEEIAIDVGAAIVVPGADIFDPTVAEEYGYGRLKNLVNSMEFERLMNAAGPYQGEILRPSDGMVPKKIAWLQCVGSRDKRFGHTYCSAVCCTYAIKQVILTTDHHPEVESTVFFNDMRTFGKGFEAFLNRARDMKDVRFIRNRISDITENRENNNLIVTYIPAENGRLVREEFDMAVLSVGLVPLKENKELSRVMGLDLNEHGFCKVDEFSPNEIAGRPGIFPAATFTGPMDIPDSISSVSGAVSRVSQLLASKRGTLVVPRQFPEEREIDGELRIGVFVCHCGANIGRVVDVPSVVDYASTLEDVVHAEDNLFSCSADASRHIMEIIREKGLNRVVVAACTPRTHEPIFQDTLREAGINKQLFVMANIREHCSWVHSREKVKATEKAKDLVAMAVARAAELSPLKEIELPVNRKGLVLGGGLAGMKAALSLAGQGFDVYLVEKEKELGGNLRDVHYTLEGMEVQPFLERLRSDVEGQRRIKVFKEYKLKSFSGSFGNFSSAITKDSSTVKELEHGIVIVATGGEVQKPAEYGYGESEKIVTQQEFEKRIVFDPSVKSLKRVAMIQCVGSRNEDRPYCSRICCGQAIKNALKLKELNKDVQILVFYRDIRTYGLAEEYYDLARKQGILFIRYEPENKPKINIKGERLSLAFREPVLDMAYEIEPDMVVLSTPVVPAANQDPAKLLKIPVTSDGFFMEAHMKLRPLDFASEGIFLCGTAHYPKNIRETISQAEGAAARAATILSQDRIISSGAVSEIDENECIGCGLCAEVCPYGAIELYAGSDGSKARVIPTVCKGCGACSPKCPADAIINNHFTDHQIISQINATYSVPIRRSEPRILAFLCNWCGYVGADLAGVSRIQYAPNVRIIRVMCLARIDPGFIKQAFLKGMDGVLVVGCHMEDCHYISGINQAVKMVQQVSKGLKKAGIDPERLWLEHISAGEGARFAEVVDGFTAAMDELGHTELDAGQRGIITELSMKNS